MINERGFSRSPNSFTIFFGGDDLQIVERSHKNFSKIEQELQKPFDEINWEKVKDLTKLKETVLNKVGKSLRYENGKFIFHNYETQEEKIIQKSYLVDTILEYSEKGMDTTKLLNFLGNLVQNPSQDSVNELFEFLEKNNMPLTDDGHFLAYKKVNIDYKDCHTGKIDNSIGQLVQMPREKVNSDRNVTCSYGLHFCSKEYLKSFNGDHIMVLKINPRDVVSIPVDYNNSKGRCCRYEVIAELENENKSLHTYSSAQTELRKEVLGNNSNKSIVFSSIKKALKGLKKEDRKEGMSVFIVNKRTVEYTFSGGITNKNFVPVANLLENIPTFKSVKEALKLYKNRVVGDRIKVANSKNSSIYQFIDGVTNRHLVKVS